MSQMYRCISYGHLQFVFFQNTGHFGRNPFSTLLVYHQVGMNAVICLHILLRSSSYKTQAWSMSWIESPRIGGKNFDLDFMTTALVKKRDICWYCRWIFAPGSSRRLFSLTALQMHEIGWWYWVLCRLPQEAHIARTHPFRKFTRLCNIKWDLNYSINQDRELWFAYHSTIFQN